MKLDNLKPDELLVLYFLLDSNDKYITIENLKKAIVNKIARYNMNYFNYIIRSLRDE